jgi:nondiscriminating aspartyl-tRNA synthetase
MQRVRSEQVATRVGQRVRVVGWLQSVRKLGAISFVIVRDATGIVQAVANEASLAPLATTSTS